MRWLGAPSCDHVDFDSAIVKHCHHEDQTAPDQAPSAPDIMVSNYMFETNLIKTYFQRLVSHNAVFALLGTLAVAFDATLRPARHDDPCAD